MAKKEKKSKLSPKAQKIVDTVSTIVEVILVAVCLAISIFVIANPGGVSKDSDSASGYNGNVNLVPVLSDSMDPTFKKNDLIFGKKITNPKEDIQDVGTIIMFLDTNADGSYFINTHRIIGYSVTYARVNEEGQPESEVKSFKLSLNALYGTNINRPSDYDVANIKNANLKTYAEFEKYAKDTLGCTALTLEGYITKGDNNSIYPEGTYYDTSVRALKNVIGTVKANDSYTKVNRVPVVGGVINWMHDPLNFGLIIMVPLVLLFVYNIYVMIKYIMEQQVKKAKAEAVASSGPAIDEEEIKRRAIEEYLARQAAANAKPAEEAPAAEEKKED